jgi:HD-GYP domain-containing protein (c-di-GMP phosphodiesterase class II)
MSVVGRSGAGPAATELDLTPVSIAALRLLDDFPCDLYRLDSSTGRGVLYRSRDLRATRQDLDQLIENGEEMLYVKVREMVRCQDLLDQQLDDLLEQDEIPAAERLGLLVTVVDPMVKRSFATLSTERVFMESVDIGRQIAGVLGRGDVVAAEVFQILRHDPCTFTHVVNVASYCVVLARRLGISEPRELEELAVAGLLHDVGKRFVSARILNKCGPLAPAEREAIESHTIKGYQELLRVGGATTAQLMVAYQHHERPNGSGYPVGVSKEEIHPLARLCSVADVFDALTCQRPYRAPLKAQAALDFMQRQSGLQFDAEMLQCWRSTMQEN